MSVLVRKKIKDKGLSMEEVTTQHKMQLRQHWQIPETSTRCNKRNQTLYKMKTFGEGIRLKRKVIQAELWITDKRKTKLFKQCLISISKCRGNDILGE